MNEINKIKALAESLYETRTLINTIEEETKNRTEPLKVKREETQKELIALMKKAELDGIKVSSGERYTKASRSGIAIKDPIKALFWARDNSCYAIDRLLVTKKLKGVDDIPKCFEHIVTEYISVRKPSVKKEE